MGFAQKIDHLLDRELLKGLAATSEGFVELDRGVLHAIVRAFRAAHEQKMLGPGDAMFAIAIQSDGEKTDNFTLAFFRFLFTRHRAAPFPQKFVNGLNKTIRSRLVPGQLQTLITLRLVIRSKRISSLAVCRTERAF